MNNYYTRNPSQYPEDTAEAQSFIGGPLNTFASTGPDLWYETEQQLWAPPPKAPTKTRSRNPGQDHVKHRRTRSGCYTCRERRVKCDEARPTCERKLPLEATLSTQHAYHKSRCSGCKKGSRKCVYPEPRPNSKPASNTGQSRTTAPGSESSSGDDGEGDIEADHGPLKRQPAAEQSAEPASKAQRRSRAASSKMNRRRSSLSLNQALRSVEQAIDAKDKSLSPSTDSSALSATPSISASLSQHEKISSVSTTTSQEGIPQVRWSHLSSDLRYHLDYHQQLTYNHYFFKQNANNFIHNILVEHAMSYEPLLYAVVGFAAFQRSLQARKSKIQEFLGYYNKSVTLLRKSLFEGREYTNATLLTILQLATFEEYLGDWVTLFGHQKAAYGLLTELYIPETVMETELQRRTLEWYSRFDLFAGIMAGHELVLGREWFCANVNYYRQQLSHYPESIDLQLESAIARHRLAVMDMATLFAKPPRGGISIQDFMRENGTLSQRIAHWMDDLSPLLSKEEYLVTSFEGARPREPDDIVDPYAPRRLYQGDLWPLNYMLLDWMSMKLMHKYHTALMLQQQPPPEIRELALEICQLFEAIEYWPQSQPGAIVAAQAVIGMAALYLPKDQRHMMWCRRKFATIEGQGYIYPPTLRSKMAELWGAPEIHHWWLPNDEGYPAIVRDIRSFIEDRSSHPQNQRRDEDERNIKGMFSKLSMQSSSDQGERHTG